MRCDGHAGSKGSYRIVCLRGYIYGVYEYRSMYSVIGGYVDVDEHEDEDGVGLGGCDA